MASPSAKPRRRRGRPRKDVPTGTWIDSDVLARRVKAIVGNRDERLDDGAKILADLVRLTRRLLGHPLSRDQRDALRALALVKREPASVITRTLVSWRHGLGERDVRRMQGTLNKAPDPAMQKPRPRVKLIYR